MTSHLKTQSEQQVTPFVGVWIEMCKFNDSILTDESLPSWECGLKSPYKSGTGIGCLVTPFVGVWIEITLKDNAQQLLGGHSLRGSVD